MRVVPGEDIGCTFFLKFCVMSPSLNFASYFRVGLVYGVYLEYTVAV